MAMSAKNIGAMISQLRKSRGCTQEELAKFVGVSAQAVSKWENGGVPDTELLPKIAEFFEITIDKLFGKGDANINITAAVFEHIRKTKPDSEERFKSIFELCWDIERSIFKFGNDVDAEMVNGGKIKDYESLNRPDGQQYSSILSDYGFTRMGIANKLQYFLFVPDTWNKEKGLLTDINYPMLFQYLSDTVIFDALLLLFKRNAEKAFTENFFVKELHVDLQKAKEIIHMLTTYHLVKKTDIELDDETKTVYTFFPTPSFVALLIFAREMIEPPQHFAFYSEGRTKPYLA